MDAFLKVSSGCRPIRRFGRRDIVGRAPQVKLVRGVSEFIPEYIRSMAWKSFGPAILGT
jgi:hypothetical protein